MYRVLVSETVTTPKDQSRTAPQAEPSRGGAASKTCWVAGGRSPGGAQSGRGARRCRSMIGPVRPSGIGGSTGRSCSSSEPLRPKDATPARIHWASHRTKGLFGPSQDESGSPAPRICRVRSWWRSRSPFRAASVLARISAYRAEQARIGSYGAPACPSDAAMPTAWRWCTMASITNLAKVFSLLSQTAEPTRADGAASATVEVEQPSRFFCCGILGYYAASAAASNAGPIRHRPRQCRARFRGCVRPHSPSCDVRRPRADHQ